MIYSNNTKNDNRANVNNNHNLRPLKKLKTNTLYSQ